MNTLLENLAASQAQFDDASQYSADVAANVPAVLYQVEQKKWDEFRRSFPFEQVLEVVPGLLKAEATKERSLEEQMNSALETVRQHVKGELPVKLAAEVEASPGGFKNVRFSCSVGGVLDKNNIYAFGESAEQVACQMLEKIAENDIVRKIKTERLKKLAEDLGVKITIR